MVKQQQALQLPSQSISQLVSAYPRELQLQAKKSVERLQTQYKIYRSAAEVARDTLECNLHQIDKIVSDLGGNPPHGPGYAAPNVEPPRGMKSDFRA